MNNLDRAEKEREREKTEKGGGESQMKKVKAYHQKISLYLIFLSLFDAF